MPTPVKILLVEDSVNDAELILQELRQAGFAPIWKRVDTESEFLNALSERPDLVISDYSMPRFDGLRAVRLLREREADTPFILISGTVGEDAAVAAMKHGATDYLLKDRIVRLGQAVQQALDQRRLRQEHHRMEQRLALQATALATAANGIAITDATGKILWVNPAMVATTGYSATELIGNNFRILKSGAHPPEFYKTFWETIRSGQTWRGEFINRRKDGSFYFDNHTITPVRSSAGEITHFVAMTQDVTERKLAEDAARARQELKIRHQAALLKLSAQGQNTFSERLREILSTDAKVLQVGRVSFWRLSREPERISCELLYLLAEDRTEFGAEFCAQEYPAYFEALHQNPLIIASNAQTDSRTAEFTETYLRPTGIGAMLDVPVWLDGHLAGVVCHEHLGAEREWTEEDRDFALSIGRLVSLALVEKQRALAEEELRATEQRLAHVLASSPATTYLLTARGSGYFPSWVSENIERLTGFKANEVQTETWWYDHIHPDDRERVTTEFAQFHIVEQSVQEYRFQRRDGSYFWVRDEKRLLRDESGAVFEIVGSWSDITEHKEVEAQRAELALRNESFVRALGEVVYDHDALNQTISWAGDSEKCIGWSIEELGHDLKAWSDRIHPDDVARVRSQFDTLAIEPLFVSEYRFRHKAGHYVWVFDRGVISRDANGRIARVVGIMWDITERKRAEEVLRENEERFRQLAENIEEVFWMTDVAKDRMIYISPSFEKIWGRSCSEVYRSPRLWVEAIVPEDRERIQIAMLTKQTAGTYDEEYRIHRPDGSTRWIRDRAFPVRDSENRVYRIVGIAEDMTRHRELEEQFRQVQKMEAVGQLASGVAHDFNNLLTVIRGSSELLLSNSNLSREDSQELLQQIVATSDRAASLTRQLLVFSRKQMMRTQTLNLNELIENLTRMLLRIVGEDIRLQCDFATDLAPVHADPGMLEQVVMNLVVNARDAMPQGGQLILRTGVARRPVQANDATLPMESKTFVRLSVSDTGVGIAPDVLPRIFEPFFTTKPSGKGTGLGLATVYGIVQQHHGQIETESEPGRGTTFHIYLPAVRKSASITEAKLTPTMQTLPRGNERILLVEDEEAVRALVRNILQRHGYEVWEADSGKPALGIWREKRDQIDLVLTDMVMPDGITGLMLAQQLRQERPNLKVIFSSGYSPEAVVKNLTTLPDSFYLQKPYNPQELLQTVRKCLDNGEAKGN